MVHMAEKYRRHNGLARSEMLFDQVFPEADDTGSGINDDDGAADSEFDAGCIAADSKGARAWDRKASPYASESNHEIVHFEYPPALMEASLVKD